MRLKCEFVCISLFCVALLFQGIRCEDDDDEMEDCCSEGQYWLYDDCVRPSSYEGSEKCINKAKECCAVAKNEKAEQCTNGMDIAKKSEDCTPLEDDEANKCCETCKLRMALGRSTKCDESDPYYSCCMMAQEEATEPSTTEKLSESNTPRAIVSDPDACDLVGNELCAHKCIPNDSSYVCTCRPGFKLRPDRHSCMKTGLDRCLKNNPCEHKCTDTGDALVCSCQRGFELLEDNVSCIDIDECEIETHKCRSGKICVNTIGSYKCVDDPTIPKAEPKPKTNINCPTGYKANKDNLVCDDINECDQNPCTAGRICVNTLGSYTCSHGGVSHITPGIPNREHPDLVEELCPPGFRLHPEVADCVDIDECAEKTHDCNDKSQFCLNMQGTFFCQNKASKTTCPPGYKIKPGEGCVDIDECAENPDVCTPDSICVNDLGSYDCKVRSPGGKAPPIYIPPVPRTKPTPSRPTNSRGSCPKGYRRTYNGGCVDIDECAENTHSCDGYQDCRNTLGSHRCDCRIGFERDPLTLACIDINECQYPEKTNCVDGQRCDNTAGSYQCLRYTSCGTGYTLNAGTGLCEDDDECISGTHNCDMLGPKYECMNIRGTFRCVKKAVPTTPSTTTTTESEYEYYYEEVETSPNTTNGISETYPKNEITTTEKVPIRYTPVYTPPREYPRYTPPPRQVPETKPSRTPPPPPPTPSTPTYIPRPRVIQPETVYVPTSVPRRTVEVRPDQEGQLSFDAKKLPDKTLVTFVPRVKHCISGYMMNQRGECVDIDECELRQFSCNPETEICQNTEGGYTCICAPGYLKESSTNICRKIEEKVTIPPPPVVPQWRNVKRTCDIGYEVDSLTNECVDIDECKDGTTRCSKDEVCQNTQGGYSCHCAPGFKLIQGRCQSTEPIRFTPPPPRKPPQTPHYISPPNRVVTITKTPVSTRITCPRGYRLSDDESRCSDIDECAYGVHSCSIDQQCINVPGGYLCRCAPGHKVSPQNVCVDVDECTEAKGRVCSQYATCVNTIGSYRCDCKDGFTLSPSPQQMCTDINECEPNGGIGPCEHKCINTWGAYRCACNKGFRLQSDNRTCIDFDECGDPHRRLCVGKCLNTLGSYECGCPKGYRLGNDHRNCIDIDECENGEKVCGPDEVCQNVRGGARCTSISCPEGYVRDTNSKHRCKRVDNYCLFGDIACQRQPNTYSYNFITFVSKLYIPTGPKPQVDLFTMKGPNWPGAKLNFNLRLVQVAAPPNVEAASLGCFSLIQSTQQALVGLLKPLVGPQEIHLELSMELYTDRMFEGTAVAKIFIYVSEYEF